MKIYLRLTYLYYNIIRHTVLLVMRVLVVILVTCGVAYARNPSDVLKGALPNLLAPEITIGMNAGDMEAVSDYSC